MRTKGFLTSKLNWLGILTLIAGLGTYADMIPAKYAPLILGIAGLATAIIRTFFTTTAKIEGVI